ISQPITHIINLIFQHNTVPDKLKFAKIVPIYKAGDSKQVQNYRPISVLPAFEKNCLKTNTRSYLQFLSRTYCNKRLSVWLP
ncbi:hypothetical protein CAPTEDRAFT_95135, partial [Capitella teleta]